MNTILKAVLTITTLAVSAFAADTKLNFRVDFPFQVGKMTMPAGTYYVNGSNDVAPGIQISSVNGKKSAFLTLPARSDSKRNEIPSVDFRCVDNQCSVVSIANLRIGARFSAWAPKLNGAKATIISVNLTASKTNAD